MPPLSPDEQRRLRRLEEAIADARSRLDALEQERSTLFESIKRWVESAMSAALKPFEDLVGDVAELKAMNERQLQFLKEAHEERGRRKQREEDAERRRKELELALAERRVVIDEKKVDPDLEKVRADARATKRGPYIALAVAVLGVLGTILAAILSSR